MRREVFPICWIAFAVACGAGQRVDAPAPESVSVRVVNHGRSDVRVVIARDGARAGLGFVTAGATGEFPVPRDLTGAGATLRLVAEPVGEAAAFASEAFSLAPGDTVEWTIRPAPGQSTLLVH